MKNTKKGLLFLSVSATLVSMLCYLSLSAIYTVLSSNVLYGSYLTVIDVLMWAVYTLSYSIIFSLFIFSASKRGTRKTLPLVFAYCGIVLVKNLLVPAINALILSVSLNATDLLYPIVVWLLDVALALAVLFVAGLKRNDLKSVALTVSILLSATTLLPRIVVDLGYGAPSSTADLLVMVVAYLSDLLVIPLFYFVSNFNFKYLQRGERL